MSDCGSIVERFTITKGIDNTFVFTIKANGSTLPIEILPTDTFRAELRNLSDGSVVLDKPLTVLSASSGRVSLTIPSEDTLSMESLRGAKEDRYYVKPVYTLILDCRTSSNGDFLAKVPAVYVD